MSTRYRTRKEISCVTFFLLIVFAWERNRIYASIDLTCMRQQQQQVCVCMFVLRHTRQIFDERLFTREKRERRNGVARKRTTQYQIDFKLIGHSWQVRIVIFESLIKFGKFDCLVCVTSLKRNTFRDCNYDCVRLPPFFPAKLVSNLLSESMSEILFD